jgi:hypothetical protein
VLYNGWELPVAGRLPFQCGQLDFLEKNEEYKMTKLLMNVLMLASVVGVAACSTSGGANTDETLTQAPYAEERTVGNAPAQETVQSAEPVFESKQVK